MKLQKLLDEYKYKKDQESIKEEIIRLVQYSIRPSLIDHANMFQDADLGLILAIIEQAFCINLVLF